MKGAIIKYKSTLERYFDITSRSCKMATMLDRRFWLGYYSVWYDEDLDNNEDPEDILRIARHTYTSDYTTSASDAAKKEPQTYFPNDFGSQMFKKPRTPVMTFIDEIGIYICV